MTEKHMLAVGTNEYNNIIRLVDFLAERGLLDKPRVNLQDVGAFTITMNKAGIFLISKNEKAEGDHDH